jgi:hypothetical protein
MNNNTRNNRNFSINHLLLCLHVGRKSDVSLSFLIPFARYITGHTCVRRQLLAFELCERRMEVQYH